MKFRLPVWLSFLKHSSMLLVYSLLFLLLSLFVPYFFTTVNLIGLGLSVSTVGMVACSMLFCMASGDFDLSVEAELILSGVICAVVMAVTRNMFLGILVGLLAGALVGALNGVIISRFKINGLISTLAMSYIIQGLSFILSNGNTVGVTEKAFFLLGNGIILGLPVPIWIAMLMFLVFGVVLNRTTFGRETLAVGGNKEAARMAGVNVNRIKVMVFSIQGLVAGAAGIILASRLTLGQPNSSGSFSLDVIAACMLGGVSQTKGTGNIRGVIVGVLMIGTLQNAMNLIGIPTFYQYLTKGTILLVAVLYDQFNGKSLSQSDAFKRIIPSKERR